MDNARIALPLLAANLLVGCFAPSAPVEGEGSTSGSTSEQPGATGSESSSSVADTETPEPTGDVDDVTGDAGSGSSSTGGIPQSCGDAVVDANEACDDGNDQSGDGCNPDCQVSGEVVWEAVVHGDDDRALSLSVLSTDDILVAGRLGPTEAEFSNWWRLYSPSGEALSTEATSGDFLSLRADPSSTRDDIRLAGALVVGDGHGTLGYPLEVGAYGADFDTLWDTGLPSLGPYPFADSFATVSPMGPGALVVAGMNRQAPSFAYHHRGFVRVFDASGTETWSFVPPEGNVNVPGGTGCYADAKAEQGFVVLCYSTEGAPL